MPVIAHLVKTQAIAGAENHLLKLLPALVSGGCDVHLIAIYDRSLGTASAQFETALQQLAARGVKLRRIAVASKWDPAGVISTARALRAIRPNLVHTHLPYADLFGSLGARIARSGRVLSSRHHDYSTSAAEIRKYRRYYRLVNPLQDAVIAISHRIAELCRTVEGRNSRTIHTVWYGCEEQAVDASRARVEIRAELGLAPGTPLLGTVGRLIDLKGHRYALEAFAQVRRSHPNVVWAIAGTGPEQQALEELAGSLGVGSSVRFLGQRSDVARLMASLDVMVHPTTAEGFGLVLLEAMIQSTPVVATRVGALAEIVVEGETGLLVPARDSAALGSAISTLLADSEGAAAMGRAGRKRYEDHFRLQQMIDGTFEVYRHVLGESR